MKDKDEVIDDSLVKMKFVTADYKVPLLLKFVEENNPNDAKQEVPLLATQLSGGSKDYIEWVKKQFKAEDENKESSESEAKPDDDQSI